MTIRLIARDASVVVTVLVLGGAAPAAEPSGCAAFKWPIDRERTVLTAVERRQLSSGTDLSALPETAVTLKLRPFAEAALPVPPERAPAPDRFAGFIRIKPIAASGTYTIALSAGGWVDVVQDGRTLKPIGFSGATDCDGVRKLVRYELATRDLLLQISGVDGSTVTLALLPVE